MYAPLFRFFMVLAVAALCGPAPTHAGTTTHFYRLGFLSDADQYSAAISISGDGSTVVGFVDVAGVGWRGVRWDASTGMSEVGMSGWATGASYDGSVIVGTNGVLAHRWTAEEGAVPLHEQMPGLFTSVAWDVSDDGSIIVGAANTWDAFRIGKPFIWTQSSGMSLLDISPTGYTDGIPFAVSGDGTVIVGKLNTPSSEFSDVSEAFYWSQDSGFVPLGQLLVTAFPQSVAHDVSHDGSVIVGYSRSPLGIWEAFRWTASEGMVGLGFLPGSTAHSYAFGVSADGSVIVGTSGSGSTCNTFVWDAAHGMRSLTDILTNQFGVDLTGWRLCSNMGVYVSADGTHIAGSGRNPEGQTEAWLAVIPEPATLTLLAFVVLLMRMRPTPRRRMNNAPADPQFE